MKEGNLKMKNVLILSSSPRKGGNTDLLCDEFAKGAKEAGNKVTKIRIAEKKIGYCTGCYACQKTHKCVIRDVPRRSSRRCRRPT